MGFNQRVSLETPGAPPVTFRTGSMGFGPYVSLYGGVLLKPGNDGRLYCIDPASGRAFWSTLVGERLRGCPVAIGPDVYVATDTAKLYTLDIASGAILGDANLSGAVAGSLATDGTNLFALSADGRLHGIHAGSGRDLWTADIAPYTESTPAVDKAVVYLADQKGMARAVQSADGKLIWSHALGSEFTGCPVVLPEYVVFGCQDGRLTALNRRTGEQVWQTQLQTSFRHEPVPVLVPAVPPATGEPVTALLCVSGGRPLLIDLASGKPLERQLAAGVVDRDGKFKLGSGSPYIGELAAPISFYDNDLAFVPVLFDYADAPIYNYDRYDKVFSGSPQLLRPVWDVVPDLKGVKAVRLAQPLRADGNLGEWGAPAFTLNRQGPNPMTAQVYLGSDGVAFGVAAVVTDDRHFNTKSGDDIRDGDAMQLGVAPSRGVHWNLALALTTNGVACQQLAGGSNMSATNASYAVVRDEAARVTRYEVSLPLATLGVKPGDSIGFNIMFMDADDGKGQTRTLTLAPGMPAPFKTELYPKFVIEK